MGEKRIIDITKQAAVPRGFIMQDSEGAIGTEKITIEDFFSQRPVVNVPLQWHVSDMATGVADPPAGSFNIDFGTDTVLFNTVGSDGYDYSIGGDAEDWAVSPLNTMAVGDTLFLKSISSEYWLRGVIESITVRGTILDVQCDEIMRGPTSAPSTNPIFQLVIGTVQRRTDNLETTDAFNESMSGAAAYQKLVNIENKVAIEALDSKVDSLAGAAAGVAGDPIYFPYDVAGSPTKMPWITRYDSSNLDIIQLDPANDWVILKQLGQYSVVYSMEILNNLSPSQSAKMQMVIRDKDTLVEYVNRMILVGEDGYTGSSGVTLDVPVVPSSTEMVVTGFKLDGVTPTDDLVIQVFEADILLQSGTSLGFNPDKVKLVAKSGTDYQSTTGAIAAIGVATQLDPWAVLHYPGIYPIGSPIVTGNYISLVGGAAIGDTAIVGAGQLLQMDSAGGKIQGMSFVLDQTTVVPALMESLDAGGTEEFLIVDCGFIHNVTGDLGGCLAVFKGASKLAISRSRFTYNQSGGNSNVKEHCMIHFQADATGSLLIDSCTFDLNILDAFDTFTVIKNDSPAIVLMSNCVFNINVNVNRNAAAIINIINFLLDTSIKVVGDCTINFIDTSTIDHIVNIFHIDAGTGEFSINNIVINYKGSGNTNFAVADTNAGATLHVHNVQAKDTPIFARGTNIIGDYSWQGKKYFVGDVVVGGVLTSNNSFIGDWAASPTFAQFAHKNYRSGSVASGFLHSSTGAARVRGTVINLDGPTICDSLMQEVVAEHADNAAAVTAGLSVGAHYRTGDLLKIVH